MELTQDQELVLRKLIKDHAASAATVQDYRAVLKGRIIDDTASAGDLEAYKSTLDYRQETPKADKLHAIERQFAIVSLYHALHKALTDAGFKLAGDVISIGPRKVELSQGSAVDDTGIVFKTSRAASTATATSRSSDRLTNKLRALVKLDNDHKFAIKSFVEKYGDDADKAAYADAKKTARAKYPQGNPQHYEYVLRENLVAEMLARPGAISLEDFKAQFVVDKKS